MVEHCETVVVGGGQAGLALSYHLRRLGCEHIVLERARLAERWRSERWDSLAFQFPSWSIRLPGHAYETDDPEGFAPRDEIVRFLERYHELVKAPVRTGVNVRAVGVNPGSSRFLAETDGGCFEAANVVVATGPYQEPALPPTAPSCRHTSSRCIRAGIALPARCRRAPCSWSAPAPRAARSPRTSRLPAAASISGGAPLADAAPLSRS